MARGRGVGRLNQALLDRLGGADQLDWLRAALDSASVPAKKGGEETGRNPTDRGKPGAKRHLVVDGRGLPLAALPPPANRHDPMVFAAPPDAVPPVCTTAGRRRTRPAKLHADKGYDDKKGREACRRRGIKHHIARKGVERSDRLGRHRWVVERTPAWPSRCRRLAVRYELRAFLLLGCSIVCLRRLEGWFW